MHSIGQTMSDERSYMLPLDAFTHVLLLLLLQDNLNEQLLQLLVTVVDAELLETDKTQMHSIIHIFIHQNGSKQKENTNMQTNGINKQDYIYTSLFTKMVAHKKKIQTYEQKAV